LVVGNHDVFNEKSEELYKQRYGKLWYSADVKDCHLVILDSEDQSAPDKIAGAQLEWLKTDLAAAKGKRIFVFLHKPLWPRGEKAFRELFRRHTPHLLQFVTRVLGPARNDAEDVVQDTWLRAYPALVTFRSESSFSTWLCSVGLRAALDSMRKGRRHVADSLFDDDAVSVPVSNDDRVDIDTAIERLAPGYRMVLVLHDVEGFTHEEIALQLGIEAGTSKAQLFKARRAMRALLTGRENQDVS
jgi:RNA polymerase sigma-70 factor (ECF subfamily)